MRFQLPPTGGGSSWLFGAIANLIGERCYAQTITDTNGQTEQVSSQAHCPAPMESTEPSKLQQGLDGTIGLVLDEVEGFLGFGGREPMCNQHLWRIATAFKY
jgi:hypothetical protein